MAGELDLDLLASIASGGMGHWYEGPNGQAYVKDDDCVACLKDLQGFFRRDDPTQRPAFFAVSQYNFARSDLVPLIVTYPEDYDVVYNALKVCVYLTMPSTEPDTVRPDQQSQRMLQVCEAFLAQDALAVIVGLLADPLSRHPKMNERDTALVELVITFLRNLLTATIPPPNASYVAEEAAKRARRGLLERLFADDVLDLALLMAQHSRERPFKSQVTVLLELFLNLFTDITPEELLNSEEKLQAMENEASKAAAAQRRAQQAPQRAPAAGGMPTIPAAIKGKTIASKGPSRTQYAAAVYMRRHLDHNASVLVRHAPAMQELPSMDSMTERRHAKAHVRDAPNANAAVNVTTLSEARLLVKLNDYLCRFLEEAYTPLVGQIFKDARAGVGVSVMEEEDFERFVRFVAFCTRYVRCREEQKLQSRMASGGSAAAGIDGEDDDKSPFECLSATMGNDAFHVVQVLIQQAGVRECSRARDKVLKNIPRKYVLLDSVGALLREMLLILDLARIAGNSSDRHAADRLQRRLVHSESKSDQGLLEFIQKEIDNFSYASHSRAHAVHMAEIMHVVLSIMDRMTKESAGLGVRQKSTTTDKRLSDAVTGADGAQPAAAAAPAADAAVAAEAEPDSTDGATAEQGQNGTTSVDPESSDSPNAVDQDAAPAEGGATIQNGPAKSAPTPPTAHQQQPTVLPRAYLEKQLELNHRIEKTVAKPSIIQFHVWLLQGYKTNAPFTNLAIIHFLNRISLAFDKGGLDLEPMLWQLSILRLFHTIMSDNAVRVNPAMSALLKLCIRVTRGLFSRLVPDLSSSEAVKKTQDVATPDVEQQDKPDGEAGEVDVEVDMKCRIAEIEPEVKQKCASLGFLEILFWKDKEKAKVCGQEYNWRRVAEGHRSGGSGTADDWAQLGFASYKGKGNSRAANFTPEEITQLTVAFEKCNGYKDCLDRLVDEFDGAFRKAIISKKLKDLGLYRGKFTYDQQERMRELIDVHAEKPPKEKFQAIADDLAAGFTGNQVKHKLRDLGLIVGGSARNGGSRRGSGSRGKKNQTAADAWDALLGSEDEGGDSDDGGRSSSDSENEASSGSDDEDAGGRSVANRDADAEPPSLDFDEIMRDDQDGTADFNRDLEIEVEGIEMRAEPAHQSSGQKRRAEDSDARAAEPAAAKSKLRRRSDDNGRAAAEDDVVEKRRAAALALLRKKYKSTAPEAEKNEHEEAQKEVEENQEPAAMETEEAVEPAALAAVEEEAGAPSPGQKSDEENQQVENVDAAPAAAPVKTFGRRLKKLARAGNDEPPAPPAPLGGFDDLEDF